MIPNGVPNLVHGDSPEAVALALAIIIDAQEHPQGAKSNASPRDHWLKLFGDCLAAVKGGTALPNAASKP
jgi:hypothetical protein